MPWLEVARHAHLCANVQMRKCANERTTKQAHTERGLRLDWPKITFLNELLSYELSRTTQKLYYIDLCTKM